MTRLPGSTACLAACAALVLFLQPIEATTVVALDDAALTRGARTIIHGDVISKESFVAAQGGRIYTEYRFAVREVLKGAADADGTVTFREWGGEVGGTHYMIPGLHGYGLGEEVVTFLGTADPRTGVGFTYGLAQGKFNVTRDAATGKAVVTRNLHELNLLPRPGGAAPASQGEGGELEAFKAKIRAEVRK
jgi:hypothetical protein